MSHGGPRSGLAVPAALAALLGLPLGALAQDGAPFPRLTLDVSPRIEADGGLDGDGSPVQAVTRLGFGLLDETPTQSFSLGADATLRLGNNDAETFDGPVLSFGYARRGADASLSVRGSFARNDVAFLRDLTDFTDEGGVIDLPEDFGDLEGTGTRQRATLDAVLTLRDDRPLGFTLSAGVTDLSYEDTTDPDLEDSTRLRLGAAARLTLGGGREVTAGLRYGRYDEDDTDGDDSSGETLGLDLAATADRPRGPLSASLSLDDTDEGVRAGLSFGRTLLLPTGALSASLGLAVGEDGDLSPTGTLAYRRENPRGDIDVSFAQALRSGDDDEEEAVTTLRAAFARALTPRASLSLDALLAQSRFTDEGEDDASEASVGASLGYALTSDWSLEAGGRLRLEDGDEEAGSTVFVGVSRRFLGTF